MRPMNEARLGIIGGSGLYELEGLREVEERVLATPFGEPSDRVVLGTLEGMRIAFLARHGRGHRLLPSEINFRANIFAMKLLGVEQIISVGAVGSLKEMFRPGDVVCPDQFYDHTTRRTSTFFGDGLVVHVSLADPVCPDLRRLLVEAVRRAAGSGAGPRPGSVHDGGLYLCIEGPQFSTRGESSLYRQWGADIIGMTNATEARLAREAQICYATMALVTDYDCWHQTEAPVTVEAVLAIMRKNTALAKRALAEVIRMPTARRHRDCPCAHALRDAVLTPLDRIPPEVRGRLDVLLNGSGG